MVWSTAEGLNDLKIETTYDWAGIATSESTGKLVVETQEVTYIGQQDLHSIEVKNLEGHDPSNAPIRSCNPFL